jgi:TP53 regulating kinase-like protein
MHKSIIAQGAEAIILQENSLIKKQRVPKAYRIPELDNKIRKARTKIEAKLLEKASKLISVPKLIKINDFTKEIVMEHIDGKKLSQHLNNFSEKEQIEICKQIGQNVAKLHDAEIIHGDLTTSNMIVVENNNESSRIKNATPSNLQNQDKISINPIRGQVGGNKTRFSKQIPLQVFFIDFGLGFHSKKPEDKAVDLHVLKEALEAKHFQHWERLFKAVIEGYKISKHHESTLERLKVVEQRGRYKDKY